MKDRSNDPRSYILLSKNVLSASLSKHFLLHGGSVFISDTETGSLSGLSVCVAGKGSLAGRILDLS